MGCVCWARRRYAPHSCATHVTRPNSKRSNYDCVNESFLIETWNGRWRFMLEEQRVKTKSMQKYTDSLRFDMLFNRRQWTIVRLRAVTDGTECEEVKKSRRNNCDFATECRYNCSINFFVSLKRSLTCQGGQEFALNSWSTRSMKNWQAQWLLLEVFFSWFSGSRASGHYASMDPRTKCNTSHH